MLPVADMHAATVKILNRLEAVGAPPSLVVVIGWDGSQIMANLGDYNKVVKSLPSERVTVERGDSLEVAGTSIKLAVARLQIALLGKTEKRGRRPPKRDHEFRRQARRSAVARGFTGD